MSQTVFVFFDTESTGLPRDSRAPAEALGNWPRLVELAWLVTDELGNELSSAERIIMPAGFKIPKDAASIHGITTEIALAEGVPLEAALTEFFADVSRASLLVAHNLTFDERVIGAECIRARRPDPLRVANRLCTMIAATDFCRLPGRYGYKWPSLAELHETLFGEPFTTAHTALADARTCAHCFIELRRRKILA